MTLLMWPILKLDSIHCFCSELCQFMDLGKDNPQRPAEVIYDFWGREDINWRKFAQKVTHKVYQELSFNQDPDLCFVVDDTLKARRGKKVEGTSQHHDHNSGKTLQGHQLLELGLVGEKGFIPLDRQIYMGNKNAITKPEGKEFHDQRSACARDMKRAQEEDKNQMLKRMMKSAMQGGYRARYLLGDSWFGNKGNIQAALDLGLHCIFQMKRGKQIYLVDGKKHTANSLYTKYQRKLTGNSDKGLYKTFRIEAQINLETDQAKPPRWQEVILVLSTPKREGAENWVIFLTTDLSLSSEQVLSIYSKRWAIEVYFKEAKQSFGLLKEQSGKYQVTYASVHLTAVRYLLIFEALVRNGGLSFGEQRDRITGQLQLLSYAGLLWKLFRFLIEGAFNKMDAVSSKLSEQIMETLDLVVEDFLNQAFHMGSEGQSFSP